MPKLKASFASNLFSEINRIIGLRFYIVFLIEFFSLKVINLKWIFKLFISLLLGVYTLSFIYLICLPTIWLSYDDGDQVTEVLFRKEDLSCTDMSLSALEINQQQIDVTNIQESTNNLLDCLSKKSITPIPVTGLEAQVLKSMTIAKSLDDYDMTKSDEGNLKNHWAIALYNLYETTKVLDSDKSLLDQYSSELDAYYNSNQQQKIVSDLEPSRNEATKQEEIIKRLEDILNRLIGSSSNNRVSIDQFKLIHTPWINNMRYVSYRNYRLKSLAKIVTSMGSSVSTSAKEDLTCPVFHNSCNLRIRPFNFFLEVRTPKKNSCLFYSNLWFNCKTTVYLYLKGLHYIFLNSLMFYPDINNATLKKNLSIRVLYAYLSLGGYNISLLKTLTGGLRLLTQSCKIILGIINLLFPIFLPLVNEEREGALEVKIIFGGWIFMIFISMGLFNSFSHHTFFTNFDSIHKRFTVYQLKPKYSQLIQNFILRIEILMIYCFMSIAALIICYSIAIISSKLDNFKSLHAILSKKQVMKNINKLEIKIVDSISDSSKQTLMALDRHLKQAKDNLISFELLDKVEALFEEFKQEVILFQTELKNDKNSIKSNQLDRIFDQAILHNLSTAHTLVHLLANNRLLLDKEELLIYYPIFKLVCMRLVIGTFLVGTTIFFCRPIELILEYFGLVYGAFAIVIKIENLLVLVFFLYPLIEGIETYTCRDLTLWKLNDLKQKKNNSWMDAIRTHQKKDNSMDGINKSMTRYVQDPEKLFQLLINLSSMTYGVYANKEYSFKNNEGFRLVDFKAPHLLILNQIHSLIDRSIQVKSFFSLKSFFSYLKPGIVNNLTVYLYEALIEDFKKSNIIKCLSSKEEFHKFLLTLITSGQLKRNIPWYIKPIVDITKPSIQDVYLLFVNCKNCKDDISRLNMYTRGTIYKYLNWILSCRQAELSYRNYGSRYPAHLQILLQGQVANILKSKYPQINYKQAAYLWHLLCDPSLKRLDKSNGVILTLANLIQPCQRYITQNNREYLDHIRTGCAIPTTAKRSLDLVHSIIIPPFLTLLSTSLYLIEIYPVYLPTGNLKFIIS